MLYKHNQLHCKKIIGRSFLSNLWDAAKGLVKTRLKFVVEKGKSLLNIGHKGCESRQKSSDQRKKLGDQQGKGVSSKR